ncbi:baseplate complex protein [Pseudomonas sp. MF7453]|uniref:baseplate complex protein n=1 Tax=Pseudomonas sp. MF7453 TaxID=2797539 RepID=UPI0018E7AD73|nr:DNA-binding protein [Pseudomonas sp. MF7453]MBJ2219612.1 DNA-binding protein [Pseudomonas sp. MF7453]
MTLLLDGQKINGKSLKVTANLRIESVDLSGQTSNTDSAHKGFKPKALTVSLLIPYRDRQHLVEIMRLAEVTAGGGQLKTYRVVNDTAEAFGVRQVIFSDTITVREDDNLAAWRVQFTLTERLSNPERVETRRPDKNVQQQGGTGVSVAASSAESDASELSGLEQILKRVDDYVGPVS